MYWYQNVMQRVISLEGSSGENVDLVVESLDQVVKKYSDCPTEDGFNVGLKSMHDVMLDNVAGLFAEELVACESLRKLQEAHANLAIDIEEARKMIYLINKRKNAVIEFQGKVDTTYVNHIRRKAVLKVRHASMLSDLEVDIKRAMGEFMDKKIRKKVSRAAMIGFGLDLKQEVRWLGYSWNGFCPEQAMADFDELTAKFNSSMDLMNSSALDLAELEKMAKLDDRDEKEVIIYAAKVVRILKCMSYFGQGSDCSRGNHD